MRIHFVVLLLLNLLASSSTFSMDNETVARRAKRVVRFFRANHLQPRTVDDSFGRDVHNALITSLDADFMLFYQSDIDYLKTMSDSLDDQILHEETRYIAEVERILLERLAEAKTSCESGFADYKTILTRKGKHVEPETYPTTASEFALLWKHSILKGMQEDLLSAIDGLHPSEYDLSAELEKSLTTIQRKMKTYFEEMALTDDYLELSYLNAITECFDPHSSFFDASIQQEFTEELSSERRLFGINYSKNDDDEYEITGIIPGSSAWFNEGIKVGDLVLRITESDGTTIEPNTSTRAEINEFFYQVTTDTIELLLKSDGVKSKVTLVKSAIYSDDDIIKTALLSGEKTNVGYISLPDFYTNWTDTSDLGCANDVAKSLMKLKKKGINGLILDLRNNGGGSVKEAIDLVGIFIDFGPVMTEKNSKGDIYTSKDFNRGSIYTGPLMVLVNSNSASASEIVSSTLQDYNRALIVGQPTFGKATSQTILPLDPKIDLYSPSYLKEDPSWGYAKITRTGIYRLTNSSLQGKGVSPDVYLPSLYPGTPIYEKDLPNSIQLENIEKKMYYTPASAFPIAELQIAQSDLKSPKIKEIQAVIDSILTLRDNLYAENDLQKAIDLQEQESTLLDRYDQLRKDVEYAYTPMSAQFDETILKMSNYLNTYNEAFMERLTTDVELNEAFKLLERQIELSK